MSAGVALSGPLWRALTCAARFGANLLAYLPLPGELALTCNALYCIPVFDMLSSWREAAVPYFVPFSFFYPKFCLKKLVNITQSIFNSHIRIWLKTKSFNMKMFLETENENKNI